MENQVISNLQYAGFTAEEKKWIETISNPDNYIKDNDAIDYLLYISDKDLITTHFRERKAMFNYTQDVWNAKKLFTVAEFAAEHKAVVDGYNTAANAYSREVNRLYKKMKSLF